MERKMFCYQCQETAGCTGCTLSGVCGKKPDVAAMQDLLVYVTKGPLRPAGAGRNGPRGSEPPCHFEPFHHHHQRQL